MKSMADIQVKTVQNWLDEINKEIAINYFFGGSRFFGYSSSQSDIDFFVYTHYLDDFLEIIVDEGFRRVSSECIAYPVEITVFQKDNIQISIFTSEISFQKHKTNNLRLKDFLNANPVMRTFVHNIYSLSPDRINGKRVFKFTGSEIYNLLLNLV